MVFAMFRLYRWIFKQSLAKLASSVIITTGFRVVCTPWNISQLLLTAGFTQPVEYYRTCQDLACFQSDFKPCLRCLTQTIDCLDLDLMCAWLPDNATFCIESSSCNECDQKTGSCVHLSHFADYNYTCESEEQNAENKIFRVITC